MSRGLLFLPDTVYVIESQIWHFIQFAFWPLRTCVGCVNEKAQLSLGKTHYSLYSSGCSTDLQGYPRSMIFILSERAYAISY